MNKEKIHFTPDGKLTNECWYCGIRAFEHYHEPNTSPKDFIAMLSDDDGLPITIPTSSTLSRREALLEVKYKVEDALETVNRLLKVIEE